MRFFFLIFLLGFITDSVQAATIYSWIDVQGVAHYGDTPQSQSRAPSGIEPFPAIADLESQPPVPVTRCSIHILSPKAQSVWKGSVKVLLESPSPNCILNWYLDEQLIKPPASGCLTGLNRGEHRLKICSLNQQGKECSPSIYFYIQHPHKKWRLK